MIRVKTATTVVFYENPSLVVAKHAPGLGDVPPLFLASLPLCSRPLSDLIVQQQLILSAPVVRLIVPNHTMFIGNISTRILLTLVYQEGVGCGVTLATCIAGTKGKKNLYVTADL